jgi:hypothetical protein
MIASRVYLQQFTLVHCREWGGVADLGDATKEEWSAVARRCGLEVKMQAHDHEAAASRPDQEGDLGEK